ncbi:MAG: hypothetical protein Rpha_1227 [Candidatus Ruthia sp. Apha_13_S6]|nr:hypothetical protein [Candidatus Ruthia sp. Apha_13_S6]
MISTNGDGFITKLEAIMSKNQPKAAGVSAQVYQNYQATCYTLCGAAVTAVALLLGGVL